MQLIFVILIFDFLEKCNVAVRICLLCVNVSFGTDQPINRYHHCAISRLIQSDCALFAFLVKKKGFKWFCFIHLSMSRAQIKGLGKRNFAASCLTTPIKHSFFSFANTFTIIFFLALLKHLRHFFVGRKWDWSVYICDAYIGEYQQQNHLLHTFSHQLIFFRFFC